jgi:putative ABC transport system ATP-binding protein
MASEMLVRLEEISKRYPRKGGFKVALDDVSLELGRGQIMGIFGPSGSGKTTLLRIAAGLQAPDSGTVSFDGERLDRMSPAERVRFRRREVACVWAPSPSQDHMDVLDHVALPLLVDRRDRRMAERLARKALLACEVEQCLAMEMRELSDGERQRVAIARALVTEPRLLLADAPASSLSLVEQEKIMSLLTSFARQGSAAVLVTDSNAETLIRADPILYLCDGKLVPERVGERGRVYRFPPTRPHRAAADA